VVEERRKYNQYFALKGRPTEVLRVVVVFSLQAHRFCGSRGIRLRCGVTAGLSVDTQPAQPQNLSRHRRFWQIGLVCLLVVAACILLFRKHYVYGSGERMRPALEPEFLSRSLAPGRSLATPIFLRPGTNLPMSMLKSSRVFGA